MSKAHRKKLREESKARRALRVPGLAVDEVLRDRELTECQRSMKAWQLARIKAVLRKSEDIPYPIIERDSSKSHNVEYDADGNIKAYTLNYRVLVPFSMPDCAAVLMDSGVIA